MDFVEEAGKKVVEYAVVGILTGAVSYLIALITRVSKKTFDAHVKKEEEYKEKVIGGLRNEIEIIKQRITDQNTTMSVALTELKSGLNAMEKQINQGFQMLERVIRDEH